MLIGNVLANPNNTTNIIRIFVCFHIIGIFDVFKINN